MEKHRYTLNPQIKHHKAVALHYLSLFRQKARPDPIYSDDVVFTDLGDIGGNDMALKQAVH